MRSSIKEKALLFIMLFISTLFFNSLAQGEQSEKEIIFNLCQEGIQKVDQLNAIDQQQIQELHLCIKEIKGGQAGHNQLVGKNLAYFVDFISLDQDIKAPIFSPVQLSADDESLEKASDFIDGLRYRDFRFFPNKTIFQLIPLLVERGMFADEYKDWVKELQKTNNFTDYIIGKISSVKEFETENIGE